MTGRRRERARWMVVVTFAAGMAWVEAACVYYLRVMVDRVEPYQPDPLPIRGILGEVELVREGATLLMLAMTGILAGRTSRARLGYAAVAFGAWDILYYVFLRIISGWPASLFDWDILFLLPLPWWGPVLAPVCIASLMIVWGTLVTQWQDRIPATRFTRVSWGVSWAGILLALGVFMADSIRALPGGPDTVRQVLPTAFNWPAFGAALLLMAMPLAHTGWRSLSIRREVSGSRRRAARSISSASP
jgi:heme exporter protein D